MESTIIMDKSLELSDKAFRDYIKTGNTDVICPECGQKPDYRESKDINGMITRASLSCKCGYIFNGEIYL